jgi:uncharacterized RDD family membrane protein YckC
LAVTGAVLLLQSVFGHSRGHHALAIAAGGGVFVVWVACYFVTFWTSTGQTPGSRVMQIRLARADGGPVGVGRALVRLIGMVVSLPLLWGYLPILWIARRRTVFDLMAGTVVTVVPPHSVRRRDAVQIPGGHFDTPQVTGAHSSGIEPPSTVP